MGAMASKITSLIIVYSTVYSGADQRKHQSSASLAFVRGNHRWSVNSQHKWPVTRKMFAFDDVIKSLGQLCRGDIRGPFYYDGLLESWHGLINTSIISVRWNYLSILKHQGVAIQFWEWASNFIWSITVCIITYPCWVQNQSVLRKWAPVSQQK